MPDTSSSRSTILESGRLILRRLDERDVSSVFQLYSDWNVSQYLSRITFPFTLEAARLFVARTKTALHEGSAYTFWSIFGREHLLLPNYHETTSSGCPACRSKGVSSETPFVVTLVQLAASLLIGICCAKERVMCCEQLLLAHGASDRS